MPPAATAQRRTRRVAPPAEVPVAEAPADEVPAALAAPTPRQRQARRIQSAVGDEKVRLPEGKRVTEVADGVLVAAISGRAFRLADSIGLMPLMEWAAAQDEVEVRNSGALLGFYRVLQDLVHPDDWTAFRAWTREKKCSDTDFIAFQNAAMEALAARPTQEPATS